MNPKDPTVGCKVPHVAAVCPYLGLSKQAFMREELVTRRNIYRHVHILRTHTHVYVCLYMAVYIRMFACVCIYIYIYIHI